MSRLGVVYPPTMPLGMSEVEALGFLNILASRPKTPERPDSSNELSKTMYTGLYDAYCICT